MIGIIGDVHGRHEKMLDAVKRHTHVDHWFQIGDLGDEGKPYPRLPDNFSFIRGNHENWEEIRKLEEAYKYGKQTFLPNGFVHVIAGVRVAVLGGNYSPKFFEIENRKLRGKRCRHYTKEDIESLKKYAGQVDIFLTHEAPSPYTVYKADVGQPTITEILKILRPSIHFFGHHHHLGFYDYDGIPSIGLEYGDKSLMTYDPENHKVDQILF